MVVQYSSFGSKVNKARLKNMNYGGRRNKIWATLIGADRFLNGTLLVDYLLSVDVGYEVVSCSDSHMCASLCPEYNNHNSKRSEHNR